MNHFRKSLTDTVTELPREDQWPYESVLFLIYEVVSILARESGWFRFINRVLSICDRVWYVGREHTADRADGASWRPSLPASAEPAPRLRADTPALGSLYT